MTLSEIESKELLVMCMNVGIDARMLSLGAFRTRGIGRYVSQLINDLPGIHPNTTYTVFAHGVVPIQQLHNVQVAELGKVPVFSKQGVVAQHVGFPIKLRNQDVDLLHYPFFEMAPAWNTHKAKTVMTVPDLIPVRTKRFGNGSKQKVFEGLLRKALQSSDAILAISAFVKHDIENFLGAGHPPVSVTPLAIDHNLFCVQDRQQATHIVRERLGICEPFILYTGGFDTRKQIAEFIQAYHDVVASEHLPHLLVLAGRFETYPSFTAIIREVARLRLQRRVIFTDYVSDEELAALYNTADAFVFPSAAEGFGLPPLEAMACGTPVVAFDNSSLPEVVGEGGVLVPDGDWPAFADALRKVLQDEAGRDDLSRRAIKQAQAFSWQRTAEKTFQVYKQVLHQN